jgi:hypothetical protein
VIDSKLAGGNPVARIPGRLGKTSLAALETSGVQQMAERFYWFTLGVLAVWRVTHLLNAEDGPADLGIRLRSMLGNTLVARVLDCFYCLSLWIALPVALFLSRSVPEGLLTWLALSGGASLLHGLARNPVVIEPLPPQVSPGGTEDVLRSEAFADESLHTNPSAGQYSQPG